MAEMPKNRKELIEAVATRLFDAPLPDAIKEAQEFLEAFEAEGACIVPADLTDEMSEAGAKAFTNIHDIWAAMLKASPFAQ